MATQYTSLLGLALPVTGELQGTWGDTVNNSITSLLDTAVAGTTTLSTDGDVTLSTTTGASNQARQAVLLCTGARTALRTITAPAQSKTYTVINATTGGFSIKVVGVGPTTGVTIVAGESALIAWNGSDFIKISNTGGSASFTNVTVSGTTTLSGLTASTALALNSSKEVVSVTNTGTGNNVLSASPTLTGTVAGASLQLSSLTSGRVTYATTSGLLTDSANMTFNGTTLTVNDLTDSSLTANRVVYATTGGNLTSSANLTFDGTTLTAANFTDSSLTSGRVTYATTGGNLTDSANLTFDGTTLTANALTVSNAVTFSGGTANGVAYLNGSKVLTTGSALTFDGTSLGIGTSSPGAKLQVTGGTTRLTSGGSGGLFGDDNASYFLLQASPTANAASIYMNGTGRAGFASHLQYGAAQHTWFNETLGTTLMVLQNSGNLGLGVTPSAWGGSSKILQISNAAFRGAGNSAYVGANYYFDGSNNRYIASAAASLYEQDAGRHIFYTAPSGTAGNAISFTQAMTLDASGNLGVGTTSPSGKVSSAVPDGATNALYLERTGGSPAQFSVTFANQFSNLISSGVMTFAVNGSERARIDASGNLLVGRTGQPVSAGQVSVYNTISTYCLSLQDRGTTGGIAFINPSNTQVGGVFINASTTTYATSSDYRLKHDIAPMTGALARVAALKPVTYKWNADDSDGEGFIAHELAEVVPQCVTGEKDAVDAEGKPVYQGIDTSFLVATLTAAIQEQQAIIEQLKADVAALKGN
jgi:hypothetical protein